MNWRKSSYSQGGTNECVEVAGTPDDLIHIRDSKRTAAPTPILTTHPAAWTAFLSSLRRGALLR
ncbi:DUF397 domain-containing protein [Streptomyces sp. NPDC021100]|uniref:DUF397 domain-containing protein n=1 Tax=Streptomyces sp. NPDC021100 TaxID=3365114 RepID=UPI0037A8A5CA